MGKKMLRIASLVLALVMALSMSAVAEVAAGVNDNMWVKGSTVLEFLGETAKADVQMSSDADGCYQIVFGSETLGLANMLIQLGQSGITLGDPNSGYLSVSYDELVRALQAANYASNFGMPFDQALAVNDYMNSEAFAEDVQMLQYVVANEVNRFAACAAEMGLVAFSDTGALTIKATLQDALTLAAEYLRRLSTANDTFATVGAMNIFPILGVDMTPYVAQLPQVAAQYASQIASLPIGDTVGEVYLNVSEMGALTANMYFAADGYEVKFAAEGAQARFEVVENGAVLFTAGLTLADVAALSMNYDVDGKKVVLNAEAGSEALAINFVNAGRAHYYEDTVTLDVLADASGVRLEKHVTNNGKNLEDVLFAFDAMTGSMLANVKTEEYGVVTTLNAVFDQTGLAIAYEEVTDYYTEKVEFTANAGGIQFNDTCTGDYLSSMIDAECLLTETGVVINATMNDGYDNITFNAVGAPTETGLALTGSLNSGSLTADFEGEMNAATGALTGKAKLVNAYGEPMLVDFSFGNGQFTLTLTVDDETVEFYGTVTETADAYSIKGGADVSLSGSDKAFPGMLFSLDLLKNVPFGHSFSFTYNDVNDNKEWYTVQEIKSAFNGSTWMLQMNGDTSVMLTGMPVESENGIEYVIYGNVDGRSVNAKAGLSVDSMVESDEVIEFSGKLYADASAAQQVGFEIPVDLRLAPTADGTVEGSFSVAINLTENGRTQKVGSVTYNMEMGQGYADHVYGTELTAEQLLGLLVPQSAY